MQDLVNKHSNPSELLADLFCSTLPTAKTGLRLSSHRRFPCCEVHDDCFAASTEALIEKYARKVMNKRSDISSSDEMAAACNVVVGTMNGLQAMK